MGTLTSLMGLARQSLMAEQAALNITSNNVANQNTPGYTRQVVNWQTRDSVTIGSMVVGGGVSVGQAGISQRDRILEQRVQQQTQIQAQSQALESALQQVQNIFGLTSTSTSATSTQLGSAMDSFFNALSSLTANPSDATTRQKVLSAANGLAGAFNTASNQMAQIATSLNQQVSSDVDQVNSLISTIASLNRQISSNSPDHDAGVVEDQRQQAIAQLSQYIGLNQISTEANGITLTTTNGEVLVSGAQAYTLSTTQIAGKTHILAGSAGQDVTQGLTGGGLGGTLEARDQQLPLFQSSLDGLAYGIGTQVNQINAQGLDGNGNPGQPLFQLPATANGAAGLIQMATSDPLAIAAAATGEGSTGNSNALLLAQLASSTIVAGQTPSSFYATLLGQIGSATAAATTDNAAQQATLAQLTTQRNALSGVSLDEEAANLTNYQRAYEAAAKVFSIVDLLMATALNLGVPTSVS
jgi:flagellar hook-associated protein 1 FlgK